MHIFLILDIFLIFSAFFSFFFILASLLFFVWFLPFCYLSIILVPFPLSFQFPLPSSLFLSFPSLSSVHIFRCTPLFPVYCTVFVLCMTSVICQNIPLFPPLLLFFLLFSLDHAGSREQEKGYLRRYLGEDNGEELCGYVWNAESIRCAPPSQDHLRIRVLKDTLYNGQKMWRCYRTDTIRRFCRATEYTRVRNIVNGSRFFPENTEFSEEKTRLYPKNMTAGSLARSGNRSAQD